jgi:hypothetical protein
MLPNRMPLAIVKQFGTLASQSTRRMTKSTR